MINIVTFAALLTNNLTNNVLSKFQESINDFLTKVSNETNSKVLSLIHEDHVLTNFKVNFSDSIFNETKSTTLNTLPDHLKEEAIQLINLKNMYDKEVVLIRHYLLELAMKSQTVDKNYQIISYEMTSYVKFLSCLPEQILNDTELLTRESSLTTSINNISEKDLYDIKQYMDKSVNDEFIEKNLNQGINNIIVKYHSLDLLTNF